MARARNPRTGKPPAFQFYAADWLASASVMSMSCAQRGAYITLLAVQWREGALPDNPAQLRRMCAAEAREWPGIWDGTSDRPGIADRFPPGEDGQRRSIRLERQRSELIGFRTAKHENGVKGAKTRWGADSAPIAQPMGNDSSASASASSTAAAKPPDQKPCGDEAAAPPAPKPEKRPRKRRDPDASPELPLVCTRDEALKAIARTSSGRFVPSSPDKGGVFKLDALRRRPDALALCERIGAWLAAGGDDWRGKLDGRSLGQNLDAWVAHAEAWNGGPVRAAPAPRNYQGMEPPGTPPTEVCEG